MSKFVTVATFTYPQEAYVIKSRLEAEGIPVFLKNELTIQTDNFLSNAIGGVQLQISEYDLDNALPLLKSANLILDKKSIQNDESNWKKWTDKKPIINKLPLELRGFAIIATVLIISTVLIILFTGP